MDSAHRWTEKEINKLSRRIGRVYGKAYREAKSTYKRMLAEYEVERKARLAALDNTKKARRKFDEWCKWESLRIQQRGQMVDQLAYDLAMTDVMAREIAMGALPKVFARNYNYSIGEIEKQLLGKVPKGFGVSFSLVDEPTVRRLIRDNPRLLPIPDTVEKGSAKFSKAVAYNKKHITTAITQSVAQGESIPEASKRISEVYAMNAKTATRYARTAMTCAQNAGRLESYFTAQDLGIDLTKEWMATGDERTRPTHLEADGQEVPIDQPFVVGDAEMDEPGDPAGGGEAWNCRCTMRSRVKGMKPGVTTLQHRAEIEAERLRRNV